MLRRRRRAWRGYDDDDEGLNDDEAEEGIANGEE
jgi:hypothetical protein